MLNYLLALNLIDTLPFEMEDEQLKPDIVDGKIIQIWSEPGIIVINTPSAAVSIPEEDWPTAKADLEQLLKK